MSARARVLRRYAAVAAVALAASAAFGVLTARVGTLDAAVEHPPDLGLVAHEIPPYPNAALLPLGDRLHTDGWGRTMAYGITTDRAEEVARRYADQFRARGLAVRHRQAGDEHVVTATEPGLTLGLIRTVIARDAGDGRTSILVSVADPVEDDVPTRIPTPPECAVAERSGARDGRMITEVATLRCAAPVDEVGAFYDAQLAGLTRQAFVEPTIDRRALRVTYAGPGLTVTVAADQPPAPEPITGASVSWQEIQP